MKGEKIMGCRMFSICNCKTAICRVLDPDESCYWYRYFTSFNKNKNKNNWFGEKIEETSNNPKIHKKVYLPKSIKIKNEESQEDEYQEDEYHAHYNTYMVKDPYVMGGYSEVVDEDSGGISLT